MKLEKINKRLQLRDDYFVSLLIEFDIYSNFINYERAQRGHDLELIKKTALEILEIMPSWNQIRIDVANRLIKKRMYICALSFLLDGLKFKSCKDEIYLNLFSVYMEIDLIKAEEYLNKLNVKSFKILEDFKILEKYCILTNGNKKALDLYINIIKYFAENKNIYLVNKVSFKIINLIYKNYEYKELPYIKAIEKRSYFKDYYKFRKSSKSLKNENNGQIRIAFCISGQLRDFINTSEYLKDFINKLDFKTDVFLSTWKTNGIRFPLYNLAHLERIFPLEFVSILNSFNLVGSDIYERYPSIKCWSESFEEIDEKLIYRIFPNIDNVSIHDDMYSDDNYIISNYGERWIRVKNQLRQFYLVEDSISNALVSDEYDVIIRIRPDIKIKVDKNINELILKCVENYNYIYTDKVNGNTPSDSIAIGSAKSMYWYSKLIDFSPFYNDINCYEESISAHTILFNHLLSTDITIQETKFIELLSFNSPRLDFEDILNLIKKDSKNRIFDSIDLEIIDFLERKKDIS